MKSDYINALQLNCPEFFARADFQAWLNKPGRATWHTGIKTPDEYADTFIIHDEHEGDGSDYDELFPEDIRLAIVAECKRHEFVYGIIRLTNMKDYA